MQRKTQFEYIRDLLRDTNRNLGSVKDQSAKYLGGDSKEITDFPTGGVSEFNWATSYFNGYVPHCTYLSTTISGGNVARRCHAESNEYTGITFYIVSGCRTFNWQKNNLCVRGEHPTLWNSSNASLVASGYFNNIFYTPNAEDLSLNASNLKYKVVSSLNGDFTQSNIESGYQARYSVELVVRENREIPLSFYANEGNNVAIYISGGKVFESGPSSYAVPTKLYFSLTKDVWTRLDIYHSVTQNNAMFELNGQLGRYVDGARIPQLLNAPTFDSGFPTTNHLRAIDLQWTNGTLDGGAKTEIYGTTDVGLGTPSGWNLVTSLPVPGNAFTDANLDNGLTKYYKMRHVNFAGDVSPYSIVTSGLTFSNPTDVQVQVIIGSGGPNSLYSTSNGWYWFSNKYGQLRIDVISTEPFSDDPVQYSYFVAPDGTQKAMAAPTGGPYDASLNDNSTLATFPCSHFYYNINSVMNLTFPQATWDGWIYVVISGYKYGTAVGSYWNLGNDPSQSRFMYDRTIPSGQIALFVGQDYVSQGTQWAWNRNITIHPKRASDGASLIYDSGVGPDRAYSGIYEARFSNDYNVYGWSPWESFTPTSTRSWTLAAGSDGYRAVYAQFRDKSLNESTICSGVIYLDTTAPSAPTGLSVIAGVDTLSIDWNDNPEEDVSYYNIYGYSTPYTLITGFPKQTIASHFLDSVPATTTRHYRVTAVDYAFNESNINSGATISGTTVNLSLDTVPPSFSTSVFHTTQNANGSIDMTWQDATDSSGIINYKVYRANGQHTITTDYQQAEVIAILGSGITGNTIEYNDADVVNTQYYTYWLSATDYNGNESVPMIMSNYVIGIYAWDQTAPPNVPTASGWAGNGRINLWAPVLSGYDIDFTRIDKSINAGTNYSEIARIKGDRYIDFLSNVSDLSTYRYRFYYIDSNGITSVTPKTIVPGTDLIVTDYLPADFTNPSVPQNVYASGDNDGRILIHWQTSASVDTEGYVIKRHLHNKQKREYTSIVDVSAPYQSSSTEFNYWFDGLIPSGGPYGLESANNNYYYQFYIGAYDYQGNLSNDIIVTKVGAPTVSGIYSVDNTPPAQITNLQATVSGLGFVYLSWSQDPSVKRNHIHVTELTQTGDTGSNPNYSTYDRRISITGSGYTDFIKARGTGASSNFVGYRVFPEDKWGNINKSAGLRISVPNNTFPNASDVAQWAHPTNYTNIDGGRIFTGSIVADSIATYYRDYDTNIEFFTSGYQTELFWRPQATSSQPKYIWIHGEAASRTTITPAGQNIHLAANNFYYLVGELNVAGAINITTILTSGWAAHSSNYLLLGYVDTNVNPAAITLRRSAGTTIDGASINTGYVRADRLQIGSQAGNLLLNASFLDASDLSGPWGWNRAGNLSVGQYSVVAGADSNPAFVAPSYLKLGANVGVEQVLHGGDSAFGSTGASIVSGLNYMLSVWSGATVGSPSIELRYQWRTSQNVPITSGSAVFALSNLIGTEGWQQLTLDMGAAPLVTNPKVSISFIGRNASIARTAIGAAQVEQGRFATPWKQGGMTSIDGGILRTGSIIANRIAAETITADRLQIGNDVNILSDYLSSFETVASGYLAEDTYMKTYIVEDVTNSGTAFHGRKSLSMFSKDISTSQYGSFTANRDINPANASYGTWLNDGSTFDVKIDPSYDYIVSFYAFSPYSAPTSATFVQLTVNFGVTGNQSGTFAITDGNYNRYSFVVTPGAIQVRAYLKFSVQTRTDRYTQCHFDGVQIEPIPKGSTKTQPSPYAPGGMTSIDGGNLRTGTIDANRVRVKSASASQTMDVYIGDINNTDPVISGTTRTLIGKWTNQDDLPNYSTLDLRNNDGILVTHKETHDVTHFSRSIYRLKRKPSNYILKTYYADYPVLLSMQMHDTTGLCFDHSAYFLPSGRMLFASYNGIGAAAGIKTYSNSETARYLLQYTYCGVKNWSTGVYDTYYLPLHINYGGNTAITNNHRIYLDGQMGIVISGFRQKFFTSTSSDGSTVVDFQPFCGSIWETSQYVNLNNWGAIPPI